QLRSLAQQSGARGRFKPEGGYPLRQLLMNVLRSSPLRDLAEASALHFFIFSCWLGVADAFRHSDMNAFRSSPFLSPALVLHAVIFSCCGVRFSSAAMAVEHVTTRQATEAKDAKRR